MSSAGAFEAELPTMQTAAGHVYEVNDTIQSQLASLLSRLEPLTAGWQGAAASSFHGLTAAWHEEATQLNAVLRTIGDGLVKTHQNYQTSDEVNQQGFTKMTGQI